MRKDQHSSGGTCKGLPQPKLLRPNFLLLISINNRRINGLYLQGSQNIFVVVLYKEIA